MAIPLAYMASRRQRSAPSLPFGWSAVTVLLVGAVLTIVGIVIILYGFIGFFTGIFNNVFGDTFSISSFFSSFFGAVMIFVIGGILAGVGGWLMRLWWLFLLVGAVTGSGGGADTVRGREALSSDVRVRCRGCGRLNPEEAKFCLSCGQPV